jgi:hypothetical protein
VSRSEEQLERARQKLNSAARFHPLTCFNLISGNQALISPTQLLFYLNEEEIVVDED